VVLRGFAQSSDAELLDALQTVVAVSPFRHMTVPGGRSMSVAMSNCGAAGWLTDRTGYRYTATDPQTDRRWPVMPPIFERVAVSAAAAAGYPGFVPDACLINRYQTGARMALHQDKDERDFAAPIVSMSFGVAAIFLWGGQKRADRPRRVTLTHGDVVVWGGPSRLCYHGVSPLRPAHHALTGASRYNLTFRKSG
jgi:alkylated DNA repair protein (DNA oxidative demethylase)